MGTERKWTRCGHILLTLLNIVPEDTKLRLSVEKSEICAITLCQTMWFLFSSSVIWSLLLNCTFPDCLIYKKMSNVRRLAQKRNMSEPMLRKQSSICLCVFSCEYNPFFVIYRSCCHPYGGPLWWCHLQSHFLISLNPPLLTKCHAYLPRSYAQAYWHTHCSFYVMLNLCPLSHGFLLNLFKIFRQVSCLSDCIVVLSKFVYWFPSFSSKG